MSICPLQRARRGGRLTFGNSRQSDPGPKFAMFSRLSTEIRFIIWKLTLEPRVVEVMYREERGFYSDVGLPTGLLVCRDSYDAVSAYYPLCFGCEWFPAKIRFNFALDTLYISEDFRGNIPSFFSLLREDACNKLQYLALDMTLFWDFESIHGREEDWIQNVFLRGLRKSLERMRGLRELFEVYDLQVWAYHIAWDSGRSFSRGALKFTDRLPNSFRYPAFVKEQELPKQYPFFSKWDVPEIRPVFGVREGLKAVKVSKPQRRYMDDSSEHFGWLAKDYDG